jgi:hypothetical protein
VDFKEVMRGYGGWRKRVFGLIHCGEYVQKRAIVIIAGVGKGASLTADPMFSFQIGIPERSIYVEPVHFRKKV